MNGDGHADLIWRNTATGGNVVWHLSGASATVLSAAALPSLPDPTWQIAIAEDVNLDGHPDLIWWNTTTSFVWVWFMNGETYIRQNPVGMASPDWVLRQ